MVSGSLHTFFYFLHEGSSGLISVALRVLARIFCLRLLNNISLDEVSIIFLYDR